MRAFTTRGSRLGAVNPVVSTSLTNAYVQAAIAQAKAKADQFTLPQVSLNLSSNPDSYSYPQDTGSKNYLPWILGGAAVLGIGGYFLLRKKR